MKMYKWFIWSWKFMKYVPMPGLFPECRGENPAILVTPLDGIELPPCFSIPMFNTHSPAKRVF